jgi:hypothetical protein
MNEAPSFSPRAVAAVVAVAVITAVGALFFAGGSQAPGPLDAAGPGAFSRSAIGYAGIARLLDQNGVAVVKSRFNTLEKLQPGSVLVIAEPRLTSATEPTIRRLLEAPAVLLVLPKWTGEPSQTHPGWLERAAVTPVYRAERVLQLVSTNGQVVRATPPSEWSMNALGAAPTPAAPVQLLRGQEFRAIVRGADGILLGELRRGERRIWVLSDPDVIANHGIGKDANAAFSIALFNALRDPGGSVVFDEMVHGYAADSSSPLGSLFQVPFVYSTVQSILAAMLLLWAATTRFGAPETLPAALSAGRQGLLRNAAGLLEFAGRQQVIVERYVQATIRYAASQLRAPRGLAEDALLGWLQRVGRARRVTIDCAEVARRAGQLGAERRPDHRALTQAARDIHRWKREIVDAR